MPCLSSRAAGRSSLAMFPRPTSLPSVSIIPIMLQSGTGVSSHFLESKDIPGWFKLLEVNIKYSVRFLVNLSIDLVILNLILVDSLWLHWDLTNTWCFQKIILLLLHRFLHFSQKDVCQLIGRDGISLRTNFLSNIHSNLLISKFSIFIKLTFENILFTIPARKYSTVS